MLDAAALIEKHKAKGVLVDTNLLVLFLVGSVNRNRIENFKRSRDFTPADFDVLKRLVAWFGSPIFSTPHVLSQVSDLTDLPGQEGRQVRRLLQEMISTIEERYDIAQEIVRHPLFQRLGLADASIATVCQRNILVMTSDLQLQVALSASGLDALNFNHVRALGW